MKGQTPQKQVVGEVAKASGIFFDYFSNQRCDTSAFIICKRILFGQEALMEFFIFWFWFLRLEFLYVLHLDLLAFLHFLFLYLFFFFMNLLQFAPQSFHFLNLYLLWIKFLFNVFRPSTAPAPFWFLFYLVFIIVHTHFLWVIISLLSWIELLFIHTKQPTAKIILIFFRGLAANLTPCL